MHPSVLYGTYPQGESFRGYTDECCPLNSYVSGCTLRGKNLGHSVVTSRIFLLRMKHKKLN
jgi:hypothetical protein